MSLLNFTNSSNGVQLLLWVYLTIEVTFCVVFYRYMIPRANRRTTPGAPFHEYGRDRCKLWFRIIDRCAAVAEKKGECPRQAIMAFMLSCFAPVVNSSTSSSSSTTTTTTPAAGAAVLTLSAAAATTTATPASPATPTTITVKSPLNAFLLQKLDSDNHEGDDDDDYDDSISDTEDSTVSSSPPRLLRVSRESMSTTSSDCGSSGGVLHDTNSCLSLSCCSDDALSVSMLPDTTTTTATTTASTTSSRSSCLLDIPDDQWTIPQLARDDVTQLFCWAIFNKPLELFEEWEHAQVQRTFRQMQEKYGLVFACGTKGLYKARQLSLEDVQSLYRPLLVYIAVFFVKYILCYSVLRLTGFQKCVSTKGLVGWYRPARNAQTQQLLPLLFFHGIAPAGVSFYLPMVLAGLAYDGRAVFLFENPNISCEFGYTALTEKETAAGVVEIVDRFIPQDQGLSLVGHSFGTFTLAWMLKYENFVERIQQYVLLDPVSLVLSEPYVLNNFVYRKDWSHTRLVAGSELFTEYYLRRFFHHYNSELWLEELPDRVQTIVALSEADEVVNALKVKEYVEHFGNRTSLELFYWRGVGHAFCVPIPSKWREIKQAMLQQEMKLLQIQHPLQRKAS